MWPLIKSFKIPIPVRIASAKSLTPRASNFHTCKNCLSQELQNFHTCKNRLSQETRAHQTPINYGGGAPDTRTHKRRRRTPLTAPPRRRKEKKDPTLSVGKKNVSDGCGGDRGGGRGEGKGQGAESNVRRNACGACMVTFFLK